LNLKQQSTDITHSLQCAALEFQCDHLSGVSRGWRGASGGLGDASTHFIQTFKKRVFQAEI